jgi:hypothetical protein
MSRKAKGASNAQSGQDAAVPRVYNPSQGGPESGRSGLLRRRRDAPSRPYCVGCCPACGLRFRDLVAAQLGFCDRCREFTGMCGAGRRIICPDMVTRTTWHTPCTELGVVAWEITQVHGRCETVLCHAHDSQVRFGGTPWIVAAVPLSKQPMGSHPHNPAADRDGPDHQAERGPAGRAGPVAGAAGRA